MREPLIALDASDRTAANKRKVKKGASAGASDIAKNVWESLPAGTVLAYPTDFLAPEEARDSYALPDGGAKIVEDMFHPPRLKFKSDEVEFRHIEQARLALALSEAGVSGSLVVPADSARCREVRERWVAYCEDLRKKLEDEIAHRTPDEQKATAALSLLLRRALRA